jgi:oligopeptide transport system permease protein
MHFLRRILVTIPVLLIISFLAFALVRIAPGGPFDRDRKPATLEIERRLKAKYHLDEPIWKQYLRYLGGLARGDLGPSLRQRTFSVNEIIAQGLPISLALGSLAFLFAMGIGIPVGFYGAVRKGHWDEFGGSFFTLLLVCVPALALGPMLVMWFGIQLRILPVGLWATPWHAVLPTVTLGLYFAGRIARLMREGMLNVLHSEFIMTARAKGLNEHTVLWKHAFGLAVLPVISYSGPLLADLLTGSFVVENIFQIPGIGVSLVNSSLNRDYTLVVGLVILYACLLLALNIIVDATYSFIDPRVKPA